MAAAVGIDWLIAGKVMAGTGLFLLVLAFARKFIFRLLNPVLAFSRWLGVCGCNS